MAPLRPSFATGRNSDILMTPDFRILIGGPGPADVKVRLGPHGDTASTTPGDTPYVLSPASSTAELTACNRASA